MFELVRFGLAVLKFYKNNQSKFKNELLKKIIKNEEFHFYIQTKKTSNEGDSIKTFDCLKL